MSAIELHARPSADFDAKLSTTRRLLQEAQAAHGADRVVQAHSLGAEDMVIGHLIDALGLDIPAFVLETGRLHAQTLALLQQMQRESRRRIVVLQPREEAIVQFVQREGADAMYKSIALRKACCDIRKMEPLARALAGQEAWITGLRREQSGARAAVPLIDRSDATRLKYNPLSDWTWGDVWHYIREQQVAYNPLHDEFYPSIGCAPCTRAISLGEDFRAGRWWWEDEAAKECGLHVTQAAEAQPLASPVSTIAAAQAERSLS
jgi:phosphoadenosine phosphosulfate reductase